MTSLRVLFTDFAWPNLDVEGQILAEVGAEIIEAPDAEESTLIELASDVVAIAACWGQVTEAVIRAASACRIISRLGIGLDNIRVDVASELGIPVTNVPDYCVEEVADHALALILACTRKVAFYHARTKSGEYALQAGPELRRQSELVLGILGLGRIGQTLAAKARALGMRVLATNASGDDHGTGSEMVSFSRLAAESDVISIHCPLTDATRHLFGSDTFQRMKPTAYLINTSRGGIIDSAALWAALQDGQIAGAGLDVFDPEPPNLSEPLYCDERVVITPHASFLSRESLQDLRVRTATQIAQALQGERPENVVNPQIWH